MSSNGATHTSQVFSNGTPTTRRAGNSPAATGRKLGVVGGRYEIVREIAHGGMGTVHEAKHLFTGRSVALKYVPAESAHADLGRQRLLQEAGALGLVRHPNVVEVFDGGECESVGPYLVMEMLEGRTLDGVLAARRTLNIEEIVHVVRAVGRGLTAAHQAGVVHRDVKPANVFVGQRSGPGGASKIIKLIDFGIAGLLSEGATFSSARITRPGDMLGTLDYVSPEQLAHPDLVDPRSDQYSLAVLIYECLVGVVPPIHDRLAGPSRLDLETSCLSVPASIRDAVARAMEPKPEARFPDVEAFVAALSTDMPESKGARVPSVEHRAPSARPEPADAPVQIRRHARAPYITPCRIFGVRGAGPGAHIDGRSEDISEGGLLIILPHTFQDAVDANLCRQSEPVLVRFALPTTNAITNVHGTVRWVKDGRGRAALGVQFDGVTDAVRESIRTYVKLVGV